MNGIWRPQTCRPVWVVLLGCSGSCQERRWWPCPPISSPIVKGHCRPTTSSHQTSELFAVPIHRRHSVLRDLFSKTSTAQLIRLAQGNRTSSGSPSITQKEAQFSKFGGQPRRFTCGSALVKSHSRGIRCHTIFCLHRFLRR